MASKSPLFKARLDGLKATVDKYIHSYLDELEGSMKTPSLAELRNSVDYSLRDGGQRIRPILSLLTAESLGKPTENVIPLGAAVELIHTYSLIHDDLPCMDDDDYRRGKLSNHKVFGEAVAVLAGDALCTEAFLLLANKYGAQPQLAVELISELALASSARGMVGGQAADVFFTDKDITQSDIEFLHLYKTGALFKASIMGAARVCGANATQLKCLADYGRTFGLVFQIADDIIDGDRSDEPSYVKLAGIDHARQTCQQLIEKARHDLEPLPHSEGLKEIVGYLYERTLN